MCDESNCQLKRPEILGLPCLRLQQVTDSLKDLSDARAKGCVRTIGDFVELVKTPTDQKTRARQSYGCEQYSDLKRSLPVWICCGVGGTKQDTIEPNGLITIDIDHIDGYEQQIKDRLCELPFVALCCLSISGHGVYALVYAPDHVRDAERVKSEIYAVVADYLSAVIDLKIVVKDGTLNQPDAANIDNCTDISRKRFEPFDTNIYVADKVKAFEPIAALIDKKWNNSRIKKLAEMMGYTDIIPNHASVGALLALAAASAKLTLWDRDLFTPNETYQARVGVVVLGDTGDGKKRIDSAVQIVADKFDGQCGNSKSTADMAYRASLSCNIQETDENKKLVWKAKQIRDVKPFIEINDEVYATITTNKQTQYAMDKAAQRRLLLDTHYNPPTTKKDCLPDYKFTPCYQFLCFSQFESYAEAVAGDRTDTGDGRRVVDCELPRYDGDGQKLEVALFKARMATPASDLDGVYQSLNDAYEHNKKRINASFETAIESLTVREIEGKSKYPDFPAMDYESRPLCQFTFFRCLDGLNDANKRDAFTHFANIATLSAYIEQRNSITTSDILIAAAISRASFALRNKVQERCAEIALADGCDKQIAWLNEYWKRPDKRVSTAKYKQAKTNNGIGLSKTTQEMVEQWERGNIIDYYEGTNKYFRRGTQEELEKIAKDLEVESAIRESTGKAFNALTLNWDTSHSHDEQYSSRKRPLFNQDEPTAQKIRVCEMINKCLTGGKCGYFVKGQRQSTLYRLRNVLTNQGMWGEIAKEVLWEHARLAGLPDKEIKRTLEKPI